MAIDRNLPPAWMDEMPGVPDDDDELLEPEEDEYDPILAEISLYQSYIDEMPDPNGIDKEVTDKYKAKIAELESQYKSR